MNDHLKIKIRTYNQEHFLKEMWRLRVDISDITYHNKELTCNILVSDLPKIKKYYHVDIIQNYSKSNIIIYLHHNILGFITLLFGLVLFFFLSNIIVSVNIETDNQAIIEYLSKELDNDGIRRLTFKKDYREIQKIKSKIKAKFNSRLEWLEIENIGMKYIINLELRKSKFIESSEPKCNIISDSDGFITNIKAESGTIMVHNNQFVKEGDILISGSIKLNEEVKTDVCSKGSVFAEEWFNVTIDIPTTYEEKEYTGKKRSNLLLEIDNRDWKILKSRFLNYDTDKKEIIGLLGHKLYLLNEYEYKYVTKKYSEDELNQHIDDLVIEKLNLSLRDDEKILYKKVLKKEANDSRIRVELFVTVEKLISKQVSY